MENNYGKVNFEGKSYELKQDAYATNYRDGVRYEAKAVSEDGEDCIVSWWTTAEWDEASEILQNYFHRSTNPETGAQGEVPMTEEEAGAEAYLQDEYNACDWENPAAVEVL